MAVVKRRDGKPVTTKAGTRLDPEVERRLAEEAEAGFDPATLTRRHAGRPSLSGRAGHSKRVDVRVDDETYEAIRRAADQDNRKVSDVVRDAISRFLETG
jgi:predicted transcriptional regulator